MKLGTMKSIVSKQKHCQRLKMNIHLSDSIFTLLATIGQTLNNTCMAMLLCLRHNTSPCIGTRGTAPSVSSLVMSPHLANGGVLVPLS